MTSGTSYDEFKVEPVQEKAFKDLLKNARLLRGWSQQQAADNSGVAQTVISYLERGPYPGMRLWDLWRLTTAYGIDVVDVRKALGWYSEGVHTEQDQRINLVVAALRTLDSHALDCILQGMEWCIAGIRSQE